MKIVITGERGYIATHLRTKLEGAVCSSFRDGADGVKLKGADVLIHCAAIVHKRERDYAGEYDRINHIEAVKLAKRAKAQGVKHFIFLSTMSVYGITTGAINRDTPCIPTTLYGKSKLEAEEEIIPLGDGDFTVTVIRPPMVYGPHCPGNFASLKALALKTPFFPKVDNKRSMIYIDNLVYAIRDIIDSRQGGVILPMDGEYVNTTDMVVRIGEATGRNIRTSRLMGRAAELVPLKIFRKVFGSLYYERDCAMLCNYIDFHRAINESIISDKK